MSWTFAESLSRARKRLEQVQDLTVTDLVRPVDFDTISLVNPRRVDGAHLYVDLPGFNATIRESDLAGQAEMIRLLHLWQREISRVVTAFDGVKVHFQGPRLHAVFYQPIGDPAAQVRRVLLAAAAAEKSASVFADVLDQGQWAVAGGVDLGRTVATRNGAAGDRELLFLGNAANRAAKILGPSGIRVTDEIIDILPEDLEGTTFPRGGAQEFDIGGSLAEAVAELGADWSEDLTRTRLRDAALSYPAGCVTVHAAAKTIDKNLLGISNTKQVVGASLFADVDGFTAAVEAAMARDDDLVDLVRQFHVLRGEGRDTAVRDFASLRVQYQGDRMQVLTYQPIGDEEAVALNAVRLSAALQSVADQVLPAAMPGVAAPTLAIGMALGEGLLTRIGEHGDRDTVSIAGATSDAATVQQSLCGHETGMDRRLRDLLPGWAADAFAWSAAPGAYVSSGLTFEELCSLEDAHQRDLAARTASRVAGAIRPGGLRPWHR